MVERALSVALAVVAAVAAWLSMGVLAVVDASRTRVGLLPPWWMLAGLLVMLVGGVLARRWPLARLWPLSITVLAWLPWVPGRVPAAFLIWQGPMLALVWLLAAAGLAGPSLSARRAWRPLADPRRAPWVAAAASVLLFGAGAWVLQPRIPDGDEPHYLVITQSLLTDGDLRIENNHARGDYFEYVDVGLRPDYLRRGQDGAIYSIHAPGLSVALLPAFFAVGYPGAVAAMVLWAALGAALLWSAAWRLGGGAGGAWLVAAAWGLSAPGFFHAFTLFPDGAGAVCTCVGLWALVRMHAGEPVRPRMLMAVGASLAALPWLHTRFAIVAGVLGVVIGLRLLNRSDRAGALAAFFAVPVLGALAWFGYFWVIWGTVNPAAPYGSYTQSGWANVPEGIVGLLLDQQFGLLPNAPAYGLALVGLGIMARSSPRLAMELILLIVPYMLAVSAYRMWWGGHSAPARFIVVVLPALALPLAMLWTPAASRRRAVATLAVAVGALIVAARALVDRGGLAYNVRDGRDLLLDWANRSVDLPLAWPSVHRDALAGAAGDGALWLGTALLVGAAAWYLSGRGPALKPDRITTVMSWALALTVMGASTLAWRGQAAIITPGPSALALLAHGPGQWPGSGWQSRPFGLLPPTAVVDRLTIESTTRVSRAAGEAPLFAATAVPAGQYELVTDAGVRPRGWLTVTAGSPPMLLEEVALADRPGGQTGLVLTLPVGVRALAIQGDEQARTSAGRLTLRPRASTPAHRGASGLAPRAIRYQDTRVFFLDDDAHMEPSGFWTRGSAATRVVVDAHRLGMAAPIAPRMSLVMRAGPVPAEVAVSAGTWRLDLRLEPGEVRTIRLPDTAPGDAALAVLLETRGGFRPAWHDPDSGDLRNLGVWVEVTGASAAPLEAR